MTDSQTLLVEYSQTGSDVAFRELVTRYVALVYSTALRLVDGDTHRAEDVAQTVFVDLARTARTLSTQVMLGGWLHRHTLFVAAKTMRGEHRRQSRERQAVEMNALQDNSGADFALVAPILDEAINELGHADRTAILLRFFEQCDFRTVGLALGSNENAARMRVTRALEKLESLLKRRGVTTGSAALAVLLGANAVSAAPVGLAVTISTTTALAGIASATTTATATKALAMTTLQKTLITVVTAAAVTTGIYQAHQASTLRTQVQNLERRHTPLTTNNESHFVAANTNATFNKIPFNWRDLESKDYHQYISNLKAVGCPWETIKDIIIADVNKMYAPKFAVFGVDSVTNVWIRGSHELAAKEAKIKGLKAEKRSLLVALLGNDIYDDVRDLSGEYSLSDARWDFLPKEKRDQARLIDETYTASAEALYARTARFHMPEDDEELRKLDAAKRVSLSAILTPLELEQLDMRNSQLGARLRLMDGVSFSEDEFMKVFRVLRESEQAGVEGKDLNLNLKAALGDEKYAEYHRAEDQNYRELYRLASRFELGPTAAAEIWDLQQRSEAQIEALARDQNLTDSQRANRKREILESARRALSGGMGMQAFQAYTNVAKAGRWLR